MSFLTKGLPHTVNINGEDVPISWDYRTSIRFIEIVRTEDRENIAPNLFRLYYPQINIQETAEEKLLALIRAQQHFFTGGKEYIPMRHRKQRDVLSYEHDAEYIYAAFLSAYKIDLVNLEEEMHWWTFRALFTGLGSDEKIMQIIGIRDADLSEYKGEARMKMAELQRAHKLPETLFGDTDKVAEIERRLEAGQSVSDLL